MYSLVRSQRATAHTLQNVSEVNRERSRLAAASSVCEPTKHNGLVTEGQASGNKTFTQLPRKKNTERIFQKPWVTDTSIWTQEK